MLVAPAASLSNSASWTARFNGPGNRDDWGVGSVADSFKTYVVGTSMGGSIVAPTNNDYETIAYNSSSGSEAWSARYDDGGADEAAAIAISPDGTKIFITGASTGAGSGFDYATIAYSAFNGKQLWVARYNGPANGADKATSISVSTDGTRVFVTGESAGSGSGSDYATVAYSTTSGSQQWVARHNGSGNANDVARAISADAANVYISGQSSGNGSAKDYTTAAYSQSSGSQLWATNYNGPGNGDDGAWSIAVNGSNVFVTGESAGSGSGSDYATISYNAVTGGQQWASRHNGSANGYDGAFSVAASPNGKRVYVTGGSSNSGSGVDFATLSYDAASGEQTWLKTYNGTANDSDYGVAIKVSPDGSRIYVAGDGTSSSNGQDFVTLAYYLTGYELWTAVTDSDYERVWLGNTLSLNPDGSKLFVTGGSTSMLGGYDIFTASYNSATGTEGDPVDTVTYNGPASGEDYPGDLVVSPDGSRYCIFGSSEYEPTNLTSGVTGSDLTTVCYNSADNSVIWEARYNPNPQHIGDEHPTAYGAHAAMNSDGSRIYVTGQSIDAGNDGNRDSDIVTVAYDSAGNQLWARTYVGTVGNDFGYSVAISPDGNSVYVSGSTETDNSVYPSYSDVILLAYDSAGQQLWVSSYDDPLTVSDSVGTMVLTPDGSKIIVGGTGLYAYDINGNQLWSDDAANAIFSLRASDDGQKFFTSSYSNYTYTIEASDTATGNQIWVNNYIGVTSQGMLGTPQLEMSPDGSRLYLAGTKFGAPSSCISSNPDALLVAYNAATGAQIWDRVFDDPDHCQDSGISLAVSPGGDRIYVAANTSRVIALTALRHDVTTIAFDASGNQLWTDSYTGANPERWLQMGGIAVSPNGSRLYSFGFDSPNATAGWGISSTDWFNLVHSAL